MEALMIMFVVQEAQATPVAALQILLGHDPRLRFALAVHLVDLGSNLVEVI
jgi:hypothetical protein